MAKKSILFSPFRIKDLSLKNRISMAPTYLGYANQDGTVSELTLDHYREMASSGVAMVVVENAAVNLVYIADHSKSKSDDPVSRSKTSHINTGFIAQNVYLYSASQGLGCVVRGYMDKEALAAKLSLNENQEIIVAQSVGIIE